MKTVAYWTDGLSRSAELDISPLPAKIDVAIVGSGYTGLCAARILATNGASVAVLERNTIGWGASSRNGGMLTPGIKAPTQTIFGRYGDQLGHVFWQASLDAIDLVEEIVFEEEIECDFQRSGHIGLAYKPAHFEEMKRRVAWFEKELGYQVQIIEPSELKNEIGSESYYGGVLDKNSAGLNPARYVQGLGVSVVRKGACLCENTNVTKIKGRSGGFQIETSQGMIQAAEVIIATNGYTDGLVPELKPRTFPVGSYIIVTDVLPPETQQRLSPNGRMFYDSKNFLNYFRLTPDGRMLFGGRNDLSTNLDLKESALRLQKRMLDVFPELHEVQITHSWTGQLGLTFDLMPHIGNINGIHYALGYCGHGISMATYVGTEIGLILAGKKRSNPFMEIPHPTKFYYRNRPWFVPIAAMYYRFLDWIR